MTQDDSDQSYSRVAQLGRSIDQLREVALAALHAGRFDLAEETLSRSQVTLAEMVENLRIYQAELQIQNEELRHSQAERDEALARFTSFFMTMPVAELVVDRQGLVMEANPEATRVFALHERHLHQHFFARLIEEEDRGKVIHAWSRLERDEQMVLRELRFRGGTKGGFIGDLYIARLPSDLDERRRLVCAVIDRTEAVRQREDLRAAHMSLRESEERYRVLAEFSPDWEYWLGANGRFLYISPACERITGYRATELIDDPALFGRLMHPEDRDRCSGHFRVLDREHDPGCLHFRILTRAGEERWIEHVCNPVYASDGRYLGRRGVNRDVTERMRAERLLRESEALRHQSEAQYRTLFESASEGLGLLREGRFVWINSAALRMLGYDAPASVLGKTPEALSPPAQPDGAPSARKARQLIASALEEGVQHFEWEHLRADGTRLPLAVALMRVEWDGKPALFVTWRDLSHERVARERELRAQIVFENTAEGILITDAEQRILAVNPAFTEITGYTEAEVLGQTPALLRSGRHDALFYQAMWSLLNKTGQWRGEFVNRRKNGEIYPQRSTITAVRDAHGQVSCYISVFEDVSYIRRSEEERYRLEHEDTLTGLPNRSLLRVTLEQAIKRARREGNVFGLLVLDLDLFKNVNDTLGHPVGDFLLQQVAAMLREKVREANSIARIGGDEFVILMEDLSQPVDIAKLGAAKLALRLLELFSRPFPAEGRELYITASIGIALFPTDGQNMDELLSHADVAMYRAKEHGRNTFRFFDPAMTAGATERLRLETALRGALARPDELSLHYQPQIRLVDGAREGVEALLRWRHPELGAVSPAVFIPIAEEIGLIRNLGAWVLERSCRQLMAWDAAGLIVPRMAVNLSVQQIESTNLLAQVKAILERTGVAPDRLELEITESMLITEKSTIEVCFLLVRWTRWWRMYSPGVGPIPSAAMFVAPINGN